MNRFFLSDHHLMHPKIYEFLRDDGALLRPWAKTDVEADEMMIEAHNRVVGPKDTIYFLGDVAIKAKGLAHLSRMNGRKILIRGNHDIFKLKQYAEHFEDIRSEHKLGDVLFSHRPFHTMELDTATWCLGNVHGHTHERHVLRPDGSRDSRYLNICVEAVGLEPLAYEEIVQRLETARRDFEATDLGM